MWELFLSHPVYMCLKAHTIELQYVILCCVIDELSYHVGISVTLLHCQFQLTFVR
jgi:hypothetical protein